MRVINEIMRKKNKCPICRYFIVAPNVWVRYHVSYDPQIVIMACKYCNYVENCLRNNKPVSLSQYGRIEKVINYHKKLGFKL